MEKEPEIVLNTQDWDIEKLDFVYGLLLNRYSSEERFANTLRNRAIFLLSMLGVILTLIFTLVGQQHVDITQSQEPIQALLITVTIIFSISIVGYFRLFLKLENPNHIPPIPDNKQLNQILHNDIDGKKGLQEKQLKELYISIKKCNRENKKILAYYHTIDWIFFTGICVGMVSLLFIIHFSPSVYIIVALAVILVMYVLIIWRMLHDLPQVIMGLRICWRAGRSHYRKLRGK